MCFVALSYDMVKLPFFRSLPKHTILREKRKSFFRWYIEGIGLEHLIDRLPYHHQIHQHVVILVIPTTHTHIYISRSRLVR